MKKILLLAAISFAAISCQQNKIAFVDNTKLINEYQEKVDIEAKYKSIIENFDKKTDSIAKAFQAEAQAFETEARSLSQVKAQEKYNALLQKRQAMGQQLQAEEQRISKDSQQEIDSLIKKVRTFVKDYGKNNGYTFVLGSNDAGSVMYGEPSNDITDAVLKAINDTYKAE